MTPMITVAMPVKNGEAFLVEAIESILNQTYRDFELLVLDDHSQDRTREIIQHYEEMDSRVRLIKAENHGFVPGLNQLIGVAQGKYFARMDGDDISELTRFEKQVTHLEAHPECSILGSWVNVFGKRADAWHYRRTFEDTATLLLMGKTPLCHCSIMARTNMMRELKYRSTYLHMEDMDLFARALLAGQKFYAIPEILLHVRVHSTSVSAQNDDMQMRHRAYIVQETLAPLLGHVDESVIDQFIRGVSYGQPYDKQLLGRFIHYMLEIQKAAQKLGIEEAEEWQKKFNQLNKSETHG